MPCRKRARPVVVADEKILQRCFCPVEETLPNRAHSGVVEALTHHGQFERIVGAEADLLGPMQVEETFDVELEEMRNQTPEGGVRMRLDRSRSGPKNAGSSWVRSVSWVTTPQLPPPPPLSTQNRSGFV
jgi:hypothetical protein